MVATESWSLIPSSILALAGLLTALSRFHHRRNEADALEDCQEDLEYEKTISARLRRKLRRV